MIQNLKIDIIYYDTPSDFEFEFNLGGCCHSRVLNSRTSSPKEMIGSLSKAVARSRVILIVGKLDGADGLFNLISKAIGLPLTEVNAEEYGIAEETDNRIIANSLPLVSTDGLLAGCIIESGPQSIILLPGAKSLRKDIAENLVFQYITAVSRTPDTETVVTPDSSADEPSVDSEPETVLMDEAAPVVEEAIIEEPVADAPVILEEQTDISAEESKDPEDILAEFLTEEIIPSEDNDIISEIIAEIPSQETDESNEQIIDIYAENVSETESADIDNNYVYNTYNTNDTYEEENDDYEEEKKPSSGINTFIYVILGLMLVIVAALVYMLVYTPLKGGVDVIEYIGQVLNI